MSNRSFMAALGALLLVGLLCVCGVGALVLTMRSDAVAGEFRELAPVVESPASEPVPVQEQQAQPQPTATQPPPVTFSGDTLSILQAEEQALNTIYENVSRSVVNISISGSENSVLGDLGEGSGFVWDEEGHIVTNNHVVADAETVIVTFYDNLQLTAEVIGTDEDSDLAVIQVEADPEILYPVTVGVSSELKVGQRAIAIGNPFGFDQTLTMGVISAIGRTVPGRDQYSLPNLIQTDAAINPGNSGGPLLDIQGRVIGVNTLIYSQTPRANSGIGFAVPVDKVTAVVPALIANGVYETPYLGIQTFSFGLTPDLAEVLEVEGTTSGLVVQLVVPDGPAAEAGVQGGDREITPEGFAQPVPAGGDVITAIDGRPVTEYADLINYLDTRRVGDQVTLTIVRDGEQMELPVTLGARP